MARKVKMLINTRGSHDNYYTLDSHFRLMVYFFFKPPKSNKLLLEITSFNRMDPKNQNFRPDRISGSRQNFDNDRIGIETENIGLMLGMVSARQLTDKIIILH